MSCITSQCLQGLPDLEASILLDNLKNPSQKPSLVPFNKIKNAYLKRLKAIFKKYDLDALVYPHTTDVLATLASGDEPAETTVSEVNIAGIPAITVPSTPNRKGGSSVPFSLVFVGLPNSEATLLALAHDYEQASMLRQVPSLIA
jgi:amidase